MSYELFDVSRKIARPAKVMPIIENVHFGKNRTPMAKYIAKAMFLEPTTHRNAGNKTIARWGTSRPRIIRYMNIGTAKLAAASFGCQ